MVLASRQAREVPIAKLVHATSRNGPGMGGDAARSRGVHGKLQCSGDLELQASSICGTTGSPRGGVTMAAGRGSQSSVGWSIYIPESQRKYPWLEAVILSIEYSNAAALDFHKAI